jgi:hypothetical protein
MKASFGEYLGALRKCEVPRKDFDPFVCGVLRLRPPSQIDRSPRDRAEWQRLRESVGEVSSQYAHELGENAYAVFNALTDLASRPPANRCVHRDRNSLQRLTGSWVTTFSQECREPQFKLGEYLGRLSAVVTAEERADSPPHFALS